MLARTPLIPLVLLGASVSLIATVLVVVGAPMAGTWSAVVATALAAGLTIPIAVVFSHHEHADSGH